MKKFMAAAAGALLIAGQVTSAMAATSDAAASATPNARVVAASYCGAQSQHQMKMHLTADQLRAGAANRCEIGEMGGSGFLFAGLIAVGIIAVAVATNNKNKRVSP